MRTALVILVLVIAGFVLLAVLAHRTPWLMADEAMYARGAWNLLHRGFMLPHVPGAMNYPPVYPMLLSIPAALVDIESSYLAYQLVNIILLVMGAIVAYSIALSYRHGIFPLLVTALYMAAPSAVVYVPMIMSENLTAFLMLFVGYALHRWSLRQESRWLLWGWGAALIAPFCRATALLVPVAFLLGIRSHPQRISLESRHWIRRALLIMACSATVLLVLLPTSVLKIYHPWSTVAVIVKTLFSFQGWVVLARHGLANTSLLLAGSGGLVLLLLGTGSSEERPIRRYLQVLLTGLLLVTTGYMQYGSAGPHAQLYAAAQRYMDPGIAASLPWLLVLTSKLRRMWAVPVIIGAAFLAVQLCPNSGFKAGQTLASAGLGLGLLEFPSSLQRCLDLW